MKSTPLGKPRFNLLHNFTAILREMGWWAALHCTLHRCRCPPPFADGFSPSFVSSWCPGDSPFCVSRVSAGDGSFLRCYLGRPQLGLPERRANAFGYASWKRIPKPHSSISASDGRKALLLPAAATYGQTSPLFSFPWALCPFYQ